MLTLAVECATKSVGLAILDEGDVLAELYLCPGRHHAEVLLPALDKLSLMAGLEPGSMDLLACTVGPGSFTGLRIGVSTIKGLALATGKPVVGVSTLEALAVNAMPSPMLICPMLDARKDQVYAGVYRMGPDDLPIAERPDRVTHVAEFLQELGQEQIVFLGDGALRHERLIRETVKGPAILCGSGQRRIMASAVGLIALRRYRSGILMDPLTLAPQYLRVSEAEATYGKRSGS
jgi:tRNA threonylcarbamoyladenosine biosynthesis protein TsaB